MHWWNEPLLSREIAAYLLLCVLTLLCLAKIISDAGSKPAPLPEDEIHGDASHLGRMNDV